MRSTTKTILSSRVTVNKQVKRHPVAVFGNEADARAYAGLIATAHKSGNADFAVALDPATELAEDRTLAPGIRFDLVTVPYSPTPGTDSDGLFDSVSPAAT